MVIEEGPRRIWYGIAVFMALAAVIGAVVWGLTSWHRLSSAVEDFERVDIPGQARLSFDEAAGYTIYYEELDPVGLVLAPPTSVAITSADSGESVPVASYVSELTYTVDDRHGVAVRTFEITEPGDYDVVVDSGGTAYTGSELAFGPGIGGTLVSAIVGSLVIAFGGIVLAAGVAVIVAVRRASIRRRQQQTPWPPPPLQGFGYSPPPPTRRGYEPPPPPRSGFETPPPPGERPW